jgi:hypothetical protein
VIGGTRISYAPRPDTTPEAELNALAAVYKYCIRKHQERKEGDAATAPDEAKKESDRRQLCQTKM